MGRPEPLRSAPEIGFRPLLFAPFQRAASWFPPAWHTFLERGYESKGWPSSNSIMNRIRKPDNSDGRLPRSVDIL